MSTGAADSGSTCIAVEAKVEFLKQPDAYPEKPRVVETVETHMSWVFLTGAYAYKLKKPVRYEFLDFSTVEARRQDCEEEVRLNRRLARDVYLNTVPLTLEPGGSLRLAGKGKAIDWLVKMLRLPAHQMLDHAIRNHTVREADINRIALVLANFYKQAPPVEIQPSEYTRRLTRDITADLGELAAPAHGLPASLVNKIGATQLQLLKGESELLKSRVRDGRVIEAHGDLRPEHICMRAEPVIIDCLEFKREFRILDAADELAFLAMECERLGAPSLGRVIFETYGQVTGDRPPDQLVRFYTIYRASLRAKLAIWHIREPHFQDPAKWSRLAMEYLRLAEKYAHHARRLHPCD